jgi:phage repressor protein C with HTH and peptisase S24 domain
MYGLSKEEKLKFIVEKSSELGISSYEYGQNTSISDLGARNILEGKSKNPRTKNLNIMLDYLESIETGKHLRGHPNFLQDPPEDFQTLKPLKTKFEVVPYYNIEISGLNLKTLEEAHNHIEFYIDYKPLNDSTGYIPYFGQSMYPMFKSGSTLAVKRIHNFDVILFGEAHLIITNENANNYKTIKCVHQHPDSNKLILRAVNPEYKGDIVIDKCDILSLYIVKGKIELNEL